MGTNAHLWAIEFESETRAAEVRCVIEDLGRGAGYGGKYLLLLDDAVVVRHSDGSFTFDQEPAPWRGYLLVCMAAGFLVGLVFGIPFTGALVGALLGSVGVVAMTAKAGISSDFLCEVEKLMQPGTSALLVVDDVNGLEVIRYAIQGLGGKVLKTNVDPDRASLIQASLAQTRAENGRSIDSQLECPARQPLDVETADRR